MLEQLWVGFKYKVVGNFYRRFSCLIAVLLPVCAHGYIPVSAVVFLLGLLTVSFAYSSECSLTMLVIFYTLFILLCF